MAQHLSQEWLDLQVELARGLPVRPGASARVQHVVSGAPDGAVSYVVVFVDGQLQAATLGTEDDVDLTVAVPHEEAVRIARAELPLDAAYMQGRAKVTGSSGTIMGLLPVTQSEEHRSMLEALAARTEF